VTTGQKAFWHLQANMKGWLKEGRIIKLKERRILELKEGRLLKPK